jgi:phosphatidylglycerophosphatase A
MTRAAKSHRPVHLPSLWRHPDLLLATGLGSGLSPWAPGTCGTLVAMGLYLAGLHLLPPVIYAAFVAVAFWTGAWLCERAERATALHDPGMLVVDEWVGYWLTMLPAVASGESGYAAALAGFALFRLFDVFKPWPANVADRKLPGGLGTMTDDMLAGGYAALVMMFIF